MEASDLIVALAAVTAIAWVNWYFFLAARRATAAAQGADGVQEARVQVRGGYEPAVIRVRSGGSVRITFDRQEASGCSEEVVFPDFGVKRFLPAFEKTMIELKPTRTGTFGFTCGMSMMQGSLIVTDEEV